MWSLIMEFDQRGSVLQSLDRCRLGTTIQLLPKLQHT
jgi:hypothetical protein